MIPESAILEWSNTVPWNSNAQVEQDLIICRALVEIFNDEFLSSHLAFRGGTALHKLYLQPQPRYSEDIDLVQIRSEPIKETIIRLSEVLSFLGKPVIKLDAAKLSKVCLILIIVSFISINAGDIMEKLSAPPINI